MAITVENEKNVTMDEVLEESGVMWDKVRASISASRGAGKDVDVDELYQSIWKEHGKFSQAYPLVVGEMVQGRFHPKAFQRYLKYLATSKWGESKDVWLHAQAHYMSILYKQIVPRWNKREAEAAEEHAYQQLKTEDEKWENNIDEIKREMDDDKKRLTDLKRAEFLAYLERLKGDTPIELSKDEKLE